MFINQKVEHFNKISRYSFYVDQKLGDVADKEDILNPHAHYNNGK